MSETIETSQQRFRSQPNLSRFAAGAKEQLVYCPITGDTQIVSNLKMQIVERCLVFATLDQHAERLCIELDYGPLHVSATRKILVELAEANLLIGEEGLIEKFATIQTERAELSTRDSIPVPLISSLGIPTRERHRDLERCVRSYAQCCLQYGRKITFVVADQSVGAEMRRTNLDMLAGLKAELDLEIVYAGVEEKRSFAKRLATHCGIAPDVVSFALVNDENCLVDTGINRNALIFSTLGELTVQVDDDSLCRTMRAPESRAGLAIDSRFNVYENWFPTKDEVDALPSRCADENFFALHEQMLGQSLQNCIERFAESNLNFDGASAAFVRQLDLQSAAVRATSIGVAGDSGIGSSHYYLNLDGDERARFVATEAGYKYSMHNHKLIRSVSRATISDVAFCSGLNLGLDNRGILPPFMPVQRGQDCIFSNLLHVCLKGYTGFLPWAILHNQSAPAGISQDDLRNRILYRRSGEIIERLVKGLAPRPNPGAARKNMVALGQILREWGTAPLADFEDLLRSMVWEEMSWGLSSLQHSLAKYESQPSFWADDINLALSWLSNGLTDENLIIAEDLRNTFGLEDARIMMQRLVRRFGELLTVWADLIQGANELGAREVHLPIVVMAK